MKPLNRPAPAFLSLSILLAASAAAAPADNPNLVANGSFEQLRGGVPADWAAVGDSAVKQELTSAPGREGGTCARLRCTSFTHRGPSSHVMLAQVGKAALEKGRMYRFSCWLRAEGLRGRQVSVAVSDTSVWANCGLDARFAAGRQWRRVEAFFTASRTIDKAGRLQLWFAETGTLWIDDVRIERVSGLQMAFTNRIEPGDSRNLLPNGSFECGRDGWASLGKSVGWGNMSGLFGEVVSEGAHDGQRCLRIELGPGKTQVNYFDYFQPVRVVQTAPLAANVGWVKVEKGQAYTLSAWLRADRAGVGATLLVRQQDPAGWPTTQTHRVKLTDKWQRYSYTVQATRGYLFVAVGPDLGDAEDAAATAWIDAVQLERGRTASDFVPREPVAVGLATERFGNVFGVDEPARLLVTGSNRTGDSVELRLTGSAEDFFGRSSPVPPCSLKLPAGRSARADWPLKLSGPGFFRLSVSWQHGGKAHSRRMRLAIIHRYAQADSPFGINHAPPTADLCRLLRDAGVVWARDWSLKWQHVEPKPGAFDPAVAVTQINRVLATGMKQVCLLPPFPSSDWASVAPQSVATKGYPGNRLRMAFAPKDPSLLDQYIERCVRHCAGRVSVWEFLNEPIYTNYSLPAANKGVRGAAYTVADYVRLLKGAYAAMKRADPKCVVIGGIGGGPQLLTREFIDAGGLDCIDVLNLHTYPGKARPEGYLQPMAELHRMMAARGKVRPIWVTEYSYYATDDLPWKPFAGSRGWAAARLLDDERQCADFSVRFAAVMLASGAEKVFYHSGASSEVNSPLLECCLLSYAGRPRKVLAAQAALADVLGPRPRFVAALTAPRRDGKAVEGLYGYVFQCGRRAVAVAWADTDVVEEGWKLHTTVKADARDIVGRPITPADAPLCPSPVYLIAQDASAQQLAESTRLLPPTR